MSVQNSQGSKDDGEEGELRVSETVLGDEQISSDLVEVDGAPLGGSAGSEGLQDLTVEGMGDKIPRTELAKATAEDKTLEHIYKVATLDKGGYYLRDGILLRTRLDMFGQTHEQICLPLPYRHKCLTQDHNIFGHQGRTKMSELIRPFFHWPSLTKDCAQHVRSCDVCQYMNRTSPRHNQVSLYL